MMITRKYLDELTYQIMGGAIAVHKELGPGLLESVYHKCFRYELFSRQLTYASEFLIPIQYKDQDVQAELRCDFLIK